MQESYQLNKKRVVIFGEEVILRELPVSFIIDVENGFVEDSLILTCKSGSDIEDKNIERMGQSQLESMYNDIMILSYGKDWQKRANESNPSKKK